MAHAFAIRRFDAHCHLDFAGNAAEIAAAAEQAGTALLSVTVTPEGYERASAQLAPFRNVRVGLGMHPWWIADGSCGKDEIERFVELVGAAPLIGEIGLDFAARRSGTEDIQLAAFDREIAACAAAGSRALSLHAVQSVDAVLDVLERHRCTDECLCILHWFSGSSDQLQRAIKLGCGFSVGSRMLASKRGRAYVKAMPVDRMFLETDEPPEPVASYAYAHLESHLDDAASQLADLLGPEVADRIARAGEFLLG